MCMKKVENALKISYIIDNSCINASLQQQLCNLLLFQSCCNVQCRVSILQIIHTHILPVFMYVITTRLTALFPGLPRWAGTRKVKPILILLKQETVSASGINWAICKSAPHSRQITMPAPHHSVFYRPDALPATQPTASKYWRHKYVINEQQKLSDCLDGPSCHSKIQKHLKSKVPPPAKVSLSTVVLVYTHSTQWSLSHYESIFQMASPSIQPLLHSSTSSW